MDNGRIARRGDVRKAELYYLRRRSGRQAPIRKKNLLKRDDKASARTALFFHVHSRGRVPLNHRGNAEV